MWLPRLYQIADAVYSRFGPQHVAILLAVGEQSEQGRVWKGWHRLRYGGPIVVACSANRRTAKSVSANHVAAENVETGAEGLEEPEGGRITPAD